MNKPDTVAIAAISWGAMILIALIILSYKHCQNMDERVLECIKSGRSPMECSNALKSVGVRNQ